MDRRMMRLAVALIERGPMDVIRVALRRGLDAMKAERGAK